MPAQPFPQPIGDPDAGGAAGRPRHVAVIMDGNGRWAQRQGVDRAMGHAQGAEALRRLLYVAEKWGIAHLSVYAFSSENWRRDPDEVEALMALMAHHLEHSVADLLAAQTRLVILGDTTRLAPALQEQLQATQQATAHQTQHTLNVAISYGGRDEILRAALKLHAALNEGHGASETLTPAYFQTFLDTAGQPDPDLIIRPSGEYRLSNFLLWQSAYSELYFTPTLWPDFGIQDLYDALKAYTQRQRRFGARPGGYALKPGQSTVPSA